MIDSSQVVVGIVWVQVGVASGAIGDDDEGLALILPGDFEDHGFELAQGRNALAKLEIIVVGERLRDEGKGGGP